MADESTMGLDEAEVKLKPGERVLTGDRRPMRAAHCYCTSTRQGDTITAVPCRLCLDLNSCWPPVVGG